MESTPFRCVEICKLHSNRGSKTSQHRYPGAYLMQSACWVAILAPHGPYQYSRGIACTEPQ